MDPTNNYGCKSETTKTNSKYFTKKKRKANSTYKFLPEILNETLERSFSSD